MVGFPTWWGSIRSVGATVALLAVLASISTQPGPSATAVGGVTQTREQPKTRPDTVPETSETKLARMPSSGGLAEGSKMPTAKQNAASSARYAGAANAYKKNQAQKAAITRATTGTSSSLTNAVNKGVVSPVSKAVQAKSASGWRPSAPTGGGGGGGGSFYGGGGGGGGDMQAMSAPAITPPSEEDYLAGDSGFQTQQSALQAALQRYLADSDFQRTNYTTDYNRSLRDLGYDEGTKAWNWDDKLTASGRGYQNQLDDFASRGMLQSQGYADAYQELLRMLGQQYDSLSGAKNTFMTDMDNQIANFKGENTANMQAARAEALQRRAAQYAL